MSNEQDERQEMVLYGGQALEKRRGGFKAQPFKISRAGRVMLDAKIMMGRGFKLAEVTLGTSETTCYEADKMIYDSVIHISNVDGSNDRTYEVHHKLNGASSADKNALCKTRTIYVGGVEYWETGTLRPGEIISGLCSVADKVAVQVYGKPEND